MIEFRHDANLKSVASYIGGRIHEALTAGKSVLWLLSGGSCIPVEIQAAIQLKIERLRLLNVSLVDERYGSPGHANSNWQTLLHAGFTLPEANLVPILCGKGREVTTEIFDGQLSELLDTCAYRIGLFGIGADGHTAGLLPGSPALSAKRLAADYAWQDFERITITAQAITRLDTAVVYAVGKAKWPAIARLHQDLATTKQPAQILKRVPELIVYSDYEGGCV